ncbi:Tn3 family transposase [Paenibacillus sp. MZ04-78.2]|uniref:Tn3 family transposase n=1 Tax=Paenibacillus sp. MZ04-78.2 TaxID=2962034 RepID=UPI0035CBC6D0
MFFGKHGELRERCITGPTPKSQCVINAISVWNTVYLGKATEYIKEKNVLQENLLHHISPLGWEHIKFLCEYTFQTKNLTVPNALRPLRIQNAESR